MTTFYSSGSLVSSFVPTRAMSWAGTTDEIPDWLVRALASYSTMYERQPWVATLVDKISVSHARLPYKVYRRDDEAGRVISDGAFARLMAQPCPGMSNFDLWQWTTATQNIHGNAFWYKERNAAGRPVAVHPRHPSRVTYDASENTWHLVDQHGQRGDQIPRSDLVHFRSFSPRSNIVGMSPLEPLRSTLENEEGARRANSAMWRNGGRPSVVLKHPKILSGDAATRLASSWNTAMSGVDNWGKTAVLEEGLEPHILPLNNEELAYIESRKLNREEVCARFDIPPPVVHILDRATFSNITEQMRSMYRDSMGWRIGALEATIETELRDGSFGRHEPDFDPDEYGEFLMDEVLRGSFEARVEALRNSEFMTLAEKRRIENLPFIEGTDRLFLNSATLPLGPDGTLQQPTTAPSADASQRSVMGRLGRVRSVAEVDVRGLVDGLDADTAARVAVAVASTNDITELRGLVAAAMEASS